MIRRSGSGPFDVRRCDGDADLEEGDITSEKRDINGEGERCGDAESKRWRKHDVDACAGDGGDNGLDQAGGRDGKEPVISRPVTRRDWSVADVPSRRPPES
mmetsp:Transcript_149288/g.371797  ORF Transcript_149288/g.371797 Transcript_149288/m.371797 type:complete len:101 (-) Transcript_149288:437-739(-)